MMETIKKFLYWVTFGAYRARRNQARRRAKYEFLKAKISERHFAGFAGLTVDFHGYKFDFEDMLSFRPPMYGIARNQKGKYCIFWDQKRLTQEIGTGSPLKEGEVLLPDNAARTRPDGTLETIDEQKPLTRQEEKPANDSDSA